MRRVVRRGMILTAALLALTGTSVFASDFVVTKIADTNDGVCDVDCSLREAIIAANQHPGADRVILGSGLTYTLTRGPADAPGALAPGSGDLDITDSLILVGNGSTIDGAGLDRVLDIEGAIVVTIDQVTIRGGISTGFLAMGGGVFIRNATVTFTNSTILGNNAGATTASAIDGGGIAAVGTFNAATGAVTPAVLTLSNTEVVSNSGLNGGGIVCVLCQLITFLSNVTGNGAMGDGAGAAVFGDGSTVNVDAGAFTGNLAIGRGGALAVPAGAGAVSVARSRIRSNTAATASGIFSTAASVNATNNWWGCNAGAGGGGTGCAAVADDVSAPVTASPFLVLQTSLSPASLNPNVNATFTADLTKNSAGTTIVTSPTLLDGLPAAFSGSFGTFAQPSVGLVVAKASDVFTAGAGVGSASLSVTVDNQTLTSAVPVVLPQVTVDHNALSFAASTNGLSFLTKTAAQTVRLTQTGIGPVTWTAVANSPWLVVSPASGSGSATLTVSVQFQYGLAESQIGSVSLTFTGAGNTAGPIGVTLTTLVAPTAPFGSFDTPQDGSTGLSGSIAVSGWALDDLQVTGVAICRDAVTGESATPDARCSSQPKIFIGNAVFIDGARPDVQAIYSAYPLSSRAGWGYLMLTNFLPNLGNGAYTIYAYASDADGHSGLLGSKTIACANSLSATPFGAIDTPGQGDTVSGIAYANFGWVLAPAPAFADPPDGGAVSVFIDGASVGSPAAWAARPDLTALFPSLQFPGISKALGVFGLDTTKLSNGLHTIAWIVTSTGGATGGVGSRFFNVANGSLVLDPAPRVSAVASSGDEVDALPVDRTPIPGRRGFDASTALTEYRIAGDSIVIDAEELDRVEIHLGAAAGRSYAGYLRAATALGALPVGSQLDPLTGDFVWQTGAGFIGRYSFVFVRTEGGSPVARVNVDIVLHPKRSNRVGPQTVIDAPAPHGPDGGPVVVNAGGFAVTGWAADFDSLADAGVDVVHVWASRVDGGAAAQPIFIGPAKVGGSRPDVAELYGARFGASGYGIVANGLAPGTYDIAVFAYSTVARHFTPARTVRVVVQ